MRDELEARLLRYVQIDTQSDETSPTAPSTTKQFDLLRLLVDELDEMEASDVLLTDFGVVYATIPATINEETVPTIAFFAHVDTAPAFSGSGVKPLVHRGYDGRPIILPDDPTQVLDPQQIPNLAEKQGEDLVTASGTTLLGADDKAGMAIIMTLANRLLRNPEIPHGRIRLCFTPDEEIGRGVDHITPQQVDAEFGYTLDGGTLGEVEFETFSADKAVINITGVAAHPGNAKGVMVNALHLAAKIADGLPQTERTPETTDGREGFIHLYEMQGNAAAAEMRLILRDFEMDGLESHAALVQELCEEAQALEPRAKVELTITPQYRNMRYWLEQDMRPVGMAMAAVEQLGIEPITTPIRGGTDGSRLTEKGLPTPNLFTGMQNIHGPLEWVSLHDMEKAVLVCEQLVQLWAQA